MSNEQLYHYNDTIDQLQQENEQLKEQLAESEDFTQGYRKECVKIQSENVQLKQQLAEKDKEITTYKEVLETYKKKPVNIYQVEIRNLQVDKAELKLELEEKDKDIKELKKQIAFREQLTSEAIAKSIELLEKNKQLRHEICEKIRNFFDVNPDVVDWDYLNEILNQIEGEKNG